jgi:hypothetical protein
MCTATRSPSSPAITGKAAISTYQNIPSPRRLTVLKNFRMAVVLPRRLKAAQTDASMLPSLRTARLSMLPLAVFGIYPAHYHLTPIRLPVNYEWKMKELLLFYYRQWFHQAVTILKK